MSGLAATVQLGQTSKFSVLDLAGSKVKHVTLSITKQEGTPPQDWMPPLSVSLSVAPPSGGEAKQPQDSKRDKTRLLESTGELIQPGKGNIGGAFSVEPNPSFLSERAAKFDAIASKQREKLAAKPRVAIKIILPDGTEKEGVSYETTPMEIAKGISKNLAKEVIVAEVRYKTRIEDDEQNVSKTDSMEDEDEEVDEDDAGEQEEPAELWDLLRPLIGDCKLRLLKFDEKEAQTVFWHSSAHCLGLAMEKKYGCHLTHGPPIENGFFYDCYMGGSAVVEGDLKELDKEVQKCSKAKHTFNRLVVTKEEALDLFDYNAFKRCDVEHLIMHPIASVMGWDAMATRREFIQTRIPDGGRTTVYRTGDFVDLCRGPHVPYSSVIQAFNSTRTSATNWLGKVENDPLQRVYAVSFPSKDRMKKFLELQKKARERDHRRVGLQQELFFFHHLSPGSAFFLPHGTRVYNRLMEFIRKEYWKRGYQEVTTPNMYNMDLWVQSGHAQHYKENMFRFGIEGAEFGLKPMNCPGHCIMFSQGVKSYRELPLRYADFGVLHRNELSGALTGLTRVRRFCQDDAHIFCRDDQITEEVLGALSFMKHVYDIFGMSYKLELSTKPKKAMGDAKLWELAENSLRDALDEFAGKGNWRVNPGDGAFYGPKIDIKVFDAMERVHQCATIQLDFQLPIRFNLKYSSGQVGGAQAEDGEAGAKEAGAPQANGKASPELAEKQGEVAGDMRRPVMVHRAMLGSLERIIAVLTEHFGGKWPFWLSPRQVMVVPVAQKYIDYAVKVKNELHAAGFYADAETSNKTLNKKLVEARLQKYTHVLVVGEVEEAAYEVNLKGVGQMKVPELIAFFQELTDQHK